LLLAAEYCVPIALGVWVRSSGIGLDSPAQPLRAALGSFSLPPGVLGLCFAGLAGAMLATSDELLNCSSLSLLADLWNIPFGGDRSTAENERLALSGKFYTGIFGLVSATLAIAAVRYGREIRDMALAIFSAQVVFVWPLLVTFFSPKLAPKLARSAIWAMGLAAFTALSLVAGSWITDDRTLADAAPLGAFFVAAIVLGTHWLWVCLMEHRKSARQQ
jgi:hypothetical protein